MATSLRDVLTELDRMLRVEAGQSGSDDAVAALAHLGRGLLRLTADGIHARHGAGRAELAMAELARACQSAAAAWAGLPRGRVSDLAGAAADVLDRIRGELNGNERWAAALQLAGAARRCAGHAEAHPPYATVPPLARVQRLAHAAEQLGAKQPPRPDRMAALDRLIPVAGLPAGLPGARIAAEAAAAVNDQLRKAGDPPRAPLRLIEVLAVIQAAQSTAHYATALTAALDPATRQRDAAQAAAAWHAVRRSLNRFDDGTRYRPGTPSTLIVWAVRQHKGLRRELDPAAWPEPRRLGDLPDLPRVITDLRAVVNQLPGIATSLQATVSAWAERGQLAARAADLDVREERVAAVVAGAATAADAVDLDDTLDTLHSARLLSTALAAQLDTVAADVGQNPQPHLAATHAATIASPAAARELAARARMLRYTTPTADRRAPPPGALPAPAPRR